MNYQKSYINKQTQIGAGAEGANAGAENAANSANEDGTVYDADYNVEDENK